VSTATPIGSVLAGYRVERLLGQGATGAVYLAEDVHLRRRTALKLLTPELARDERFRNRFLLESQLAASLEHPHIVPIYGAGEIEDVLFIAMKYVDGYDLRGLLDSSDPLEPERVTGLLAQVADALDAAHGLGLVHRDVKPANVLIAAGDEEHAFLCDFGLAKHASSVNSLTGERAFVGTIAYIAPEQIESGAVDARADVYSLACVLYECLTGATPFDREGELQVVFAHLKEPPPLATARRPDLPAEIDAVLAKGLAKAPDDRYSTCGGLISAAAGALDHDAPVVARPTRRTAAGVRTFMIADVRGYTSYTHEHGDEAAAELASAFADVVRSVVEERKGRLIELRGDEALVVFDSARAALRVAVELQRRLEQSPLPRRIGIGLDAGEAVPVGDGYRGGALNLAARLCSVAGPGEVLASETVVQLAGSVEGLRYGERRVERLKGIAKPVPAIEVLPEDRRVHAWDRRRLARVVRRTSRRRPVQVAAGLTAAGALAAVLVLMLAGGGGGRPPVVAEQSIAAIGPKGTIAWQTPVGGNGELAYGDGALWFSNLDDHNVARVDLKTHELVRPLISTGIGQGGFAVGFGSVWVEDESTPTLYRIDPRYGAVADRIKLPVGKNQVDNTAPSEVAVGAGSVWVTTANLVFRLDPQTLKVQQQIPVPGGTLLEYANGALWVASSGYGTIKKIDPAVNRVVSTVKLHDWISDITVGGGFVWATITPDDTLWKVDVNGSIVKTYDIGHDPSSPVFVNGAVWVPVQGGIARVDGATDEITRYPLAGRSGQAFAVGSQLYLTTGESPPPLAPLPAGKVATFSLAEDYIDDTDPATATPNPYRLQLEYATQAMLLNYPDAPAPEGSYLRPEVATAMPVVSNHGLTYTFRVRSGYRFSPPSNAPLTADTFRYSIERAISPRLGQNAFAIEFVGDIVGVQAFHGGKAKHVSGIRVHGNEISFTLVAPAGDFPARISMPFFAPVPIGTPIIKGGVQGHGIPSAGPYYLVQKWGSERAVLERNPNYRGSRPHGFERIVYDINNSTRRTVARISGGLADYTADFQQESTFALGGPLDIRFGSRAARQRLFLTPQLGVSYFEMNTRRGVFTDAGLRRAVNFAIDRRQLAAQRNEVPTQGYLAPGLPGYTSLNVYSLRPNVAKARALVRGRHPTATLFTCQRSDCEARAQVLRANLSAVGIRLRVKKFDDQWTAAAAPGAKWDIVGLSWFDDYPDPFDSLNALLDTAGFRQSWLRRDVNVSPDFQRALRQAAATTGAARYSAYAALHKRLVRDEAPWAAYSTPVLPEFFSARIGCQIFQPVIGTVDIGSLCLRRP
jgi:ABC-type transport system substrate-binding protein/class 3 adenylate cyclase/streptogramin lyase/tRNA A-37 threonylcarbamoyl transferase component Bud32